MAVPHFGNSDATAHEQTILIDSALKRISQRKILCPWFNDATSRLLALWCLVGFFLQSAAIPAQVPREYQLKAVFLFHFAQFVDWPGDAFASAEAPITVGVLGNNPFGEALELAVRGESVGGRSLAVKQFRDVKKIDACHVLFISRSEAARLPEILAALKGRSILTVGEDENFNARGGMIQFVMQENRVRFRINRKVAEAVQLKLSSKLLRLAQQ